MFWDNQGVIALALNLVSNSSSKHIDLRHHLAREPVDKSKGLTAHVEPEYQHAYFLTKPLDRYYFEVHRDFVVNMT